MPNQASDFAQKQADRTWYRWSENAIKSRRLMLQRLESAGNYLDYNAETERHRIRLWSGRIVEAESITNTGLDENDPVVVQGKRFKAMPR